MSGAVPLLPKFQFSNNGAPMSGGTVTVYLAGTVTPSNTWQDEALTILNTNPIVLDARGEAVIYLNPALSYKFLLKNSGGVTQWTQDNVKGGATAAELAAALAAVGTLRADLAASGGSALVGDIAAEAGAVTTTQQALNRLKLHAGAHFDCDNTGATNTTTKLKAFYDACILSGKPGVIPAGTYKLTTGVLVFDNGFADKTWPQIETAGHNAVNFVIDAATATDAPLLKWSNGTATSTASRYWRGGSHGGVTITDATGAVAPNRHGISLTGTWGIQFGHFKGVGLRGSLVSVPPNLYGGNNPDPYASSYTTFDAIEANSCAGFGLDNRNYVGMDSWTVNNFRAVDCLSGGWYGCGSGTYCPQFVVANCFGWAYDDGTQAGAPGGSPQRNFFGVAELDNVQYGLRLSKTSLSKFEGWRVIHRFNVAPNVSGLYWPRTAVSLAAGTDANINNVHIQVFHRIEGGGVLGNLGTVLDGHSSGNIIGVTVDTDFADNGALGVTNSKLFSNVANSAVVYITRNSKSLFDTRDKAVSFAIGSAASTIIPTALGTLAWSSQGWGTYSVPMVLATGLFTAPRRGLYTVTARLPLTMAIGTRLRIQLLTSVGGVKGQQTSYQVNAGNQSHLYSTSVVLAAGETVALQADQGTAGDLAVSPQQAEDCVFTVAEV